MTMALGEDGGALAAVRDSEASAWLNAPPELVSSAKSVSEQIFALGLKYVPKNRLRKLFTEGFDAEQIWQQIEIQDRPLLAAVMRQIKDLDRIDGQDLFGIDQLRNAAGVQAPSDEEPDLGHEEEESSESEDEEHLPGDEEEDEKGTPTAVDDKFLKVTDMEKFLEDAEAAYQRGDEEDEADEDDEMDDEQDEDDEDGEDQLRYEDFFVKDKSNKRKKVKENEAREEEDDDDDQGGEEEEEDEELNGEKTKEELDTIQENDTKSSHEIQREKIQKRIEMLERANMDPKDWTMTGEVTAATRPKNSALEVDLDFEHNVRPAPVITEEVTASIEDIIRRRIIEGQFDDVERKQKLPDMPPAEKREIDETKSTKGLGELYEEDYMQSAGLASAPATESDLLKREATTLFKTLCMKLDALSHFHFAPKPVIEDMTVREDVPALAMEEVAPVFVSDVSMLAPQEMFSGKGEIKDEKELDHKDRKRRRATKKRKFKAQQKAEQQQQKKPRTGDKTDDASATPAAAPKKGTSKFVKSSKMFAELDRLKGDGATKAPPKEEKTIRPSALKL